MPEIGRKNIQKNIQSKLPENVIIKHGAWYVRRSFPAKGRYEGGRRKYVLVDKRCKPETPERAAEIFEQIGAEAAAAMHPKEEAVADLTVGEYLARFLAAKTKRVSERTIEMDADLLERFVKDTNFAGKIFSEVRTRIVEDYYDYLSDVRGATPDTIARVNKLLSGAFHYGIQRGDVVVNPTKRAIRPVVPKTEVSVFTEAEAVAFLEVCRKDDANVVFEFALETFARPEEYVALHLADVNLNRCLVTIRHKAVYNKKRREWEYKIPKSKKSRRTIEITPQLCSRLEAHLARRERWIAGVGTDKRYRDHAHAVLKNLHKHDLFFPSGNGTPLWVANLNRREFRNVVKTSGLDPSRYTVYTLRHTGITLSLANNANIKAVSEKAGHASVAFTLDTYGHVIPSMRSQATKAISETLYPENIR